MRPALSAASAKPPAPHRSSALAPAAWAIGATSPAPITPPTPPAAARRGTCRRSVRASNQSLTATQNASSTAAWSCLTAMNPMIAVARGA